jgi:hypothetical protein
MPSTLAQANSGSTIKPSGGNQTAGSLSGKGGQVNDPVTAIVKGAADVINNAFNTVVNNLFNRKKVNAEIKLAQDEQKFKSSLATLDNQQKYLLNVKLNNAKTKTERLKILEDSLKDIQVARVSKPTDYTVPIILVSCVLGLVVTLIIVKKDN